MKMKLYRIVPLTGQEVFISASKTDAAAAIYITDLDEQGQHAYEFSIERFDTRVKGDWRPSMVEMLSRGLQGIATYSEAQGWSVRQP